MPRYRIVTVIQCQKPDDCGIHFACAGCTCPRKRKKRTRAMRRLRWPRGGFVGKLYITRG